MLPKKLKQRKRVKYFLTRKENKVGDLTKTTSRESDFCKKCGFIIEFDKSTELMSSPPKYRGDCRNCGEIYYVNCSEVG